MISAFFVGLAVPPAALAEWTETAELCSRVAESHEQTLAFCTEAIESGKLDAAQLSRTYVNRAYELNRLGQTTEAERDATRAIELDASNAGAWSNRGKYRTQLGRFDEALTDYHEALRLAPTFDGNATVGLGPEFDASFGIALIHANRGERDAGADQATRLFAAMPEEEALQDLFRWYGLR